MISGGLGALIVVSALKVPAASEPELRPEHRALTPALLQLRAGVSAANGNGADLNAQLRGKCKTNCKQDKEIGKLKGQQGTGVKTFDKLVMIAKQIDEILDANNKILGDVTQQLTGAISQNKRDWGDVNEDLKARIMDYKDGHSLKFAAGNKVVDKTMQAVASFFAHMKKKFVDMNDLIEFNQANVEDYLKVQSQKQGKEVSRLGDAVSEMRLALTDLMGQTKGTISAKIKENAVMQVGRVNAADESVALSAEKMQNKIGDAERNDAIKGYNQLKELKREMDRIQKDGGRLIMKERKAADKEGSKQQNDLRGHVQDIGKEEKALFNEVKSTHKYVGDDIKMDITDMDRSNQDASHNLEIKMRDKSESSADSMKQDMKYVYDELLDKGMNSENVLQAVTYLANYGKDELRKLSAQQFELKQADQDSIRDLNNLWGDDFNNAMHDENQENQNLVDKVRNNNENLDQQAENTTTGLAKTLGDIAEKTDFTSQAFDDAFENMKKKSIKSFDDNVGWANEMADGLAAFGLSADALGEGLGMQIADTQKMEREAATAGSSYAKSYSKTLKDKMGAQHQELEARDAALMKQMEDSAKASKSKFLGDLGGLQQHADKAMGDEANELSKFSTNFQTGQAEFSKKMSMNSGEEAKQAGQVGDMDRDALATADEIKKGQDKFDTNMQKNKMEATTYLQQRMRASSDTLDDELQAARAGSERDVNGAVADWKAGYKTESNDVRSLEAHMIGGVGAFKSQTTRADSSLRNLDVEAQEYSAQVNTDFAKAKAALDNQEAKAGMETAKLREQMEEKSAALEKLGRDTISKLSTDHYVQFTNAANERDRKIQAIMSEGETVSEGMAKRIQDAELQFQSKMSKLHTVAVGTTGDVEAMATHQQKQLEGVEMALENSQSAEKATTLMVAEDKAGQERLLEEERDKMMKVIKAKLGTLDGDLEKQMQASMEERDEQIMKVLNDNSRSMEDRQAEIERLDAQSHDRIKELAKQQVGLDQQLMTFETEQGEQSGAVDLQLRMLGGVLKEEQMAWLKGVLTSKDELKQITEDIGKNVDSLLNIFEGDDAGMYGEVEKAKAAARQKLASVKEEMAELNAEHGHMAEEAIKLADEARDAVGQENTEVDTTIKDTEGKMQSASDALHATDEDTSAQIAAERKARLEALGDEREQAIGQIHELLDKISEAAKEMSKVAVGSADKQRAFEQKLQHVRQRLEAEGVKASQSFTQLSRTLDAYADMVLRAATARRDAARNRAEALAFEAKGGDVKVGALQAHQQDLQETGVHGVEKAYAAARGAAERTAQLATEHADAVEQETANWVGAELHNAHAYIQQTNAEVEKGLEEQRASAAELQDRAASRFKAEIQQDAALHRDVAALGSKVSGADTTLQRLENTVDAQIEQVERDGDSHRADADREIAALQREVAAASLLEAPRDQRHAAQRFRLLEAQVAENEAKTRRYERENEVMRAKVEAAVAREFATHQYAPADRARVERVLEGI